MKFIDKNGRLFGKISVIDVLVLLVAAVMAVALYVKNNQRNITSNVITDEVVTFQVRSQGLRSYVAEAVQVGDLLYEEGSDTGGALGKIVDVQLLPGTRKAYYYAEGAIETDTPAEDCLTLLITVEGNGILSDGEYMLNRVYHLGINANRTFATKFAIFSGQIWDILS